MTYCRVTVGQRCFLADDTVDRSPAAYGLFLQLHADGSGAYAHRMHDITPSQWSTSGPDAELSHLIEDELLLLSVLSGLRRLSHHARDRAAAGGNVLVRAQLVSASHDRPLTIGHTRRHHGRFTDYRNDVVVRLPIRQATLQPLSMTSPKKALLWSRRRPS